MNNYLLKKTLTSFLYVVLAVTIEFFVFASFGWGVFPKYAFFDLGIIFFIAFLIFLIPSQKLSNAFVCVLISLQIVVAYTNIVMMQTLNNVVSINMLALVRETTDVVSIKMFPWAPILFFAIVISVMIVTMLFLRKIPVETKKKNKNKKNKWIARFVVLFGLTLSMLVYSLQANFLKKETDETYLLGDNYLYHNFASGKLSLKYFGSFCYYIESIGRLVFDINQIYVVSYDSAIEYMKTDTYKPEDSKLWNAVSKNGDDNIFVIMGESFEWYPISKEITPILYAMANGYDFGENGERLFGMYNFVLDENGSLKIERRDYDYNEETGTYSKIDGVSIYDETYENIYGMTLTSYYSKAKTDYSEDSVILGNYPYNKSFVERVGFSGTGLYQDINYNFSLPNVLKDSGYIEQGNAWYFHTYKSEFYGRESLIPQFGFDRTYFYEYFTQNPKIETGPTIGNCIKDSQVMSEFGNLFVHCDENGNPVSDKPWLSFFTTVTTHGDYFYNPLLKKNYDLLQLVQYPGKPEGNILQSSEEDMYVATYLASVMDTDQMMAYFLYYLIQTGQYNNTTIVFYGDHNSYYESIDMTYKSKYYDQTEDAYSNFRSDYIKENFEIGDYSNISPERYAVACFVYGRDLDESVLGTIVQNGQTQKLQYIDKFACAFDLAPTIFTMCGINYDPHYYLGYPIFCVEEIDGEWYELGSKLIDSHTGGYFNNKIFTEDGLVADYMIEGANMKQFSVDCVQHLERWYNITALYDYNLFKKVPKRN